MATGEVRVNVVDVGQGQSTFVQIFDNSGNLIHTLLFDCGSDKESDETTRNLQYMANQISNMSTPKIDGIFFSHSDKDHIWLTYDLLNMCSKKPSVDVVWYAGAYDKYTKYGFNTLDYLVSQKYVAKGNMVTNNSNYTGYDATKGELTEYLWKSADNEVYVYALVSNVLSDDPDWDDGDLDVTGKTAEALNRVSMVCGLYYAGASYVICGDATNTTMAAFGTLFKGTTVFNGNIMTTLPHHGSRATGFAVKASETPSLAATSVVNTFSILLKSTTVTISAYEKHKHPSMLLISYFNPNTATILRDARLKQKNAHMLTAYADIDLGTSSGMTIYSRVVYSFENTDNIFSTRYYDGYPTFSYDFGPFNKAKPTKGFVAHSTINSFACWNYFTKSDGSFLLAGVANLTETPFTSAATTTTTTTVAASQLPQAAEAELVEAAPAPPTVRIRRKRQRQLRPAHQSSRLRQRLVQFP